MKVLFLLSLNEFNDKSTHVIILLITFDNDDNPLRHNDAECRHQIVILLKVITDVAPCSVLKVKRNISKTLKLSKY